MADQSEKDLKRQKENNEEKVTALDKCNQELTSAEREFQKKIKELEIMKKKKLKTCETRDQNNNEKVCKASDFQFISETYDAKKKEVELLKKDIENKMRERDLLNKDVVEAEEKKI